MTRGERLTRVIREFERQPTCHKMGFNIDVNGTRSSAKCRFGLIADNENVCDSPDAVAGIGCCRQDICFGAGAIVYVALSVCFTEVFVSCASNLQHQKRDL
eukprot:TRINITY_DN12219_c1_g1_i6.p1 TRINITY_DN12219_c1_g1~~TRINITY_DN12219_c1_g1_i6.p1  ORF type:complete len:101 (+),score=4.32 TRINITY_DN12219_c1_g1_i6:850-1152(+)